jgi:hypothetical protein
MTARFACLGVVFLAVGCGAPSADSSDGGGYLACDPLPSVDAGGPTLHDTTGDLGSLGCATVCDMDASSSWDAWFCVYDVYPEGGSRAYEAGPIPVRCIPDLHCHEP